ncbi:MAG: DUF58 domain-containing protein [Dehalococcoidia bacterium]
MRRVFRWIVRPSNPTLVLVIAILVLAAVVATGTGFWLLFRLSYVLAFALPVTWLIAWYNTRGLQVRVDRRTDRGQVGQEAQEVIEVFNTGILPKLWLEVDDPSEMSGHSAKRVVIVPPRGSRSWIVDTRLTRRGLFEWGPVTISSSDPFGFFRRTRTFGEPQQILVYPPVVDLPHFQAPPANLPGEGRFRRRTHYVTPNASGIREYAPGDAFNRIAWKAMARTDKIMVKTFELDPASDIWIVLDLEQRVNFGSGDQSTEEYGVRVAASVARHYLGQNRSVGLISFGRSLQVVEPERGGQQLTRVLESLAMASAVGEGPLINVLMEEGNRFGRHTTLIAVTSATDDHWVTGLQSLVQRGVRVAVVLIDASSFGDSRSPIMVFSELAASNIPTYVVRKDDDLTAVLSPTGGQGQWQG